MITRIVSYFFLAMLFIAFFLAMLGVQQIETGDEYYWGLNLISQQFNTWKIEIPDIPKIPTIEHDSSDTTGLILRVLVNFVNFLVTMVNVVITIVNILILIVNYVIQVIQFICTCLWCSKQLIERIAENNVSEILVFR